MKCACGKIALYQVRKQGFCKDHYAEAVEAQKKEKTLALSAASVGQYQVISSRRAANR